MTPPGSERDEDSREGALSHMGRQLWVLRSPFLSPQVGAPAGHQVMGDTNQQPQHPPTTSSTGWVME